MRTLYTYILYLNILMHPLEARTLLFAFPSETHDRGTRPAGFTRSIASNADGRACTRVRGSFCWRNFGKLARQLGDSMPRNDPPSLCVFKRRLKADTDRFRSPYYRWYLLPFVRVGSSGFRDELTRFLPNAATSPSGEATRLPQFTGSLCYKSTLNLL